MFGPKLTSVFASRWRAIWFCVSVLLFVYSVVPSAPAEDKNGAGAAESSSTEQGGTSPAADETLKKALSNLKKAENL